jgi:hypothetical protein
MAPHILDFRVSPDRVLSSDDGAKQKPHAVTRTLDHAGPNQYEDMVRNIVKGPGE